MRNESAGDTTAPRRSSCKRDANAQVVLNQLYKHTPMQTSFAGEHARARRRRAARCSTSTRRSSVYVDHQIEVVTRRTEYRLRKAKEREHIVEGLVKALDMIDAIIALIRGAGRRRRRPRRADGEAVRVLRDPGQPHPRHAAAPAHAARGPEAARRARGARRPRSRSSSRSSRARRSSRTVIKDELAEVREQVRRRAPHASSPPTPARSTCSTSSRTKRSSSCSRSKGYIKTVAADAFRAQGRGGRGVRGGNLARRGLRRAPAHDHRALVPVVLLEPRPGLPAARARDPDEGPHRARHRARRTSSPLAQDERIEAIIDTRTYEDGAYLFFATQQRHGEEDAR